jgi:hypothetical protein
MNTIDISSEVDDTHMSDPPNVAMRQETFESNVTMGQEWPQKQLEPLPEGFNFTMKQETFMPNVAMKQEPLLSEIEPVRLPEGFNFIMKRDEQEPRTEPNKSLPPLEEWEERLLCRGSAMDKEISIEQMKNLIHEERSKPHAYWRRMHYHEMQDVVHFEAEGHKYYIHGSSRHVISLTKFIGCFFDEFDAVKESTRMASGKTHRSKVHQPSYKYHNCFCAEDFRKRWDHAAFLGTDFHRNVEWFLNGIPFEQQIIHPENKICVQQFLEIFHDKEFWEWDTFWTEQPLCYPPALLAGTPDIILKSKHDPKVLIIIDLKRCEGLDYTTYGANTRGYGPCNKIIKSKMNSYGLQQSGLKWLLQTYGYQVKHMFLLNVHPSLKKARILVVQDFTPEFQLMINYRMNLLHNYISSPSSSRSMDVEPEEKEVLSARINEEEERAPLKEASNSNMRQDNLICILSHSMPETINSAELNETVLIS